MLCPTCDRPRAGLGRRGVRPPDRILRPMRLRSLLFVVALLVSACTGTVGATDRPVRILGGAPATIDPAAAGDSGSSAIITQLFETLTAFDDARTLQPALAESWRLEDDGRRVVFQLRDDLTFSDGTPLRASDVVRSWLRLVDPAAPSPLVSLMLDVQGAAAYLTGQAPVDDVGLRADDTTNEVTVDLVRPAADFVTVVASPTFAVVPPSMTRAPAEQQPSDSFVASGGYRLVGETATGLTLQANPRYWAGEPAVTDIEIVTDLGGRSPVAAFEDDELDYAPIGSYDASWIAFDPTLGPQLREVPSLSVEYYGFDTRRAPFDDVRVRQAFAAAVDWRRIATLASDDPASVATSMVPPGIPGRSERDVVPVHDPAVARQLLADAGYPGGRGFPPVTIVTGGSAYDEAIVTQIRDELGIDLAQETMADGYFDRLVVDPPQIWSLGWVADYPGRNDFLGVLLATGSTNNYGRWSSADFDAAIADAGATTDEAATAAAYDRAEDIVREEAPVIPVSYGTGWALARDGLLGARQNGLGSLRYAGLDWAP
jgi:ABC-type oligopeptide transport system substrate-binding subunit